jgi:uncharacterized membrane protein YbhN (UPF0104 family)
VHHVAAPHGALGYLGFDMAVLWLSLHAVGSPISILANSLPVPGGIGVLDAGIAGELVLYGASPTHAAAAVLIYHNIAFWIPGLGGVLAFARVRPRLTEPEAVSASSTTSSASNPSPIAGPS